MDPPPRPPSGARPLPDDDRGEGVALVPLSCDAEESVTPPSVTLLQRFFFAGGGIGGVPLLAAVMRAAAMLPGQSTAAAEAADVIGLGGDAYHPPRPKQLPFAGVSG